MRLRGPAGERRRGGAADVFEGMRKRQERKEEREERRESLFAPLACNCVETSTSHPDDQSHEGSTPQPACT
jgi:hypothetical protein